MQEPRARLPASSPPLFWTRLHYSVSPSVQWGIIQRHWGERTARASPLGLKFLPGIAQQNGKPDTTLLICNKKWIDGKIRLDNISQRTGNLSIENGSQIPGGRLSGCDPCANHHQTQRIRSMAKLVNLGAGFTGGVCHRGVSNLILLAEYCPRQSRTARSQLVDPEKN
ncbi:hypothetical protein BJX63DRAFT_156663 [Aspergillus granulosus]|uniref:Uncharacterized protein n=1 Tax=Aspergillus granulosus TaxID=176169 RepID=A0ABR4HK04_9EURO